MTSRPLKFNDFKELPHAVLRELAKIDTLAEFSKRDVIYRSEQAAHHVYFVTSGLVGIFRTTEKGNDYLLRVFKGGQFFGHRAFFAGEPYHVTAVCLEPARIAKLPGEMIHNLIDRHPEVAHYFLKHLAQELGRAEIQRVQLSDQDVLSRVASALLFLKEHYAGHVWTRQEIAQFCGSTTPTVIRAMASLESQGLIAQNGRQVQILDGQGLLQIASLH